MPASLVRSSASCAASAAWAAAAVSVAFFVLTTFATPASAQGFKILHTFCQDQNCPDGFTPSALRPDGGGNYYGTTRGGGLHGGGTIFELKRRANGSYKFETL